MEVRINSVYLRFYGKHKHSSEYDTEFRAKIPDIYPVKRYLKLFILCLINNGTEN